jgi:type IV pilus assembly protein PilB
MAADAAAAHEEADLFRRMRLGDILVRSGALTAEQIEAAVARHRGKNLKLGKILIIEGLIAEARIVEILSEQLRIPRYTAGVSPVDPELAALLPAELAHRLQAVPTQRDGGLLTVVMTDPLRVFGIEEIERATGLEVAPVICTEDELNRLLRLLYPNYGAIDDVLDGLPGMQIEEHETGFAGEEIEVSSLRGMAEDAPVVKLVATILSQAVRDRASDVHLMPEKGRLRLRYRIDGRLHDMPAPGKRYFLAVISRIKILAGIDISVSRRPQDGRFTARVDGREINVRVATIPSIHGENIVLRLLDMGAAIFTLERLGMTTADRRRVEASLRLPHGMLLCTGPTGSGKSTTLYAMLREINQPHVHIITVEDPVEYRMEGIMQVQLNPKAGMDFANGLRSILRQDPDVIMVGEIRDTETARIAVQAALTGHRVLSSLHTNDAAGAVTRLLDMGLESYLVASVLNLCIAQRLVRRICPDCREPVRPPETILKLWGLDAGADKEFFAGRGCFNCMGTGYRGRSGVYEVLSIDEPLRRLIARSRPAAEIARTARKKGGFVPLVTNALEQILEGVTTFEEASSAVMF